MSGILKNISKISNELLNNPLIVALDVDDKAQALKLADELCEIAGAFKLGPRLCVKYGAELVGEIAKRAPVFVDNKYFDIPSTMVAAVQASFDAGATLVTVHAQAGAEALGELAALEKKLNEQRPFKILAVTILTSFSEDQLPKILKSQKIADHVVQLADLVQESGLGGIVCSSHELSYLKDKGLYLVTPGIRFVEDGNQDQKRVMGPTEALVAGASAIVVGRPIITADSARESAMDYMMAVLQKK